MSDPVDRLRGHVYVLAELIGERANAHALDAARTYIRRELESHGHAVTESRFDTIGRKGVNLEVLLPGSNPKLPTLVVGAHYDTVQGTPGADDNASAVAVLLEVARAFAGVKPRRTVRLVAYDCEEPPYFNFGMMGSVAHARECKQRGERLLGMVCLESLGYYADRATPAFRPPFYARWLDRLIGARHVVIVSDLNSIPFGLRFLRHWIFHGRSRFVPFAAPQKIGVIGLSDHRSYWWSGYRALMITDTAILRNPNYHVESDRLETLDLPRLTRVSGQVARTILRLAR